MGSRYMPLPLPFRCAGHNTLHAQHPAPCMVTTVLRSPPSKACEGVWAPLWTRQHLVPGGPDHTLTLKQWVLRAEAGTLFAGSHGGLPEGREKWQGRRGMEILGCFYPSSGQTTEPWLWEPHLSGADCSLMSPASTQVSSER